MANSIDGVATTRKRQLCSVMMCCFTPSAFHCARCKTLSSIRAEAVLKTPAIKELSTLEGDAAILL